VRVGLPGGVVARGLHLGVGLVPGARDLLVGGLAHLVERLLGGGADPAGLRDRRVGPAALGVRTAGCLLQLCLEVLDPGGQATSSVTAS
jgi:hypothetical protein